MALHVMPGQVQGAPGRLLLQATSPKFGSSTMPWRNWSRMATSVALEGNSEGNWKAAPKQTVTCRYTRPIRRKGNTSIPPIDVTCKIASEQEGSCHRLKSSASCLQVEFCVPILLPFLSGIGKAHMPYSKRPASRCTHTTKKGAVHNSEERSCAQQLSKELCTTP